MFQPKFCLHTRYSIQNYFKYKDKNKMIVIIENILIMQVEKSSSEQKQVSVK